MTNLLTEAHSELCQTSKMEIFAKSVNSFQPFTIFAKVPSLNVWQGSEYYFDLGSNFFCDTLKLLEVCFKRILESFKTFFETL